MNGMGKLDPRDEHVVYPQGLGTKVLGFGISAVLFGLLVSHAEDTIAAE